MMKIIVLIIAILLSFILVAWVYNVTLFNINATLERVRFLVLLIFMIFGFLFLCANYRICLNSPGLFKVAFVFGIITIWPTIFYNEEGFTQLFFKLLEIWQWILSIMIGYIISYKGKEYGTLFNNLFIILTLPLVSYFIYASLSVNLLIGDIRTADVSLILIVLFPFALQLKKESIKVITIISISVIALLSFKRTVMIGIAVMTLVHYYFLFTKSKFSKFSKFLIFSFGIILVLSLYQIFTFIDDESGGYVLQRLNNIQEDRGSGRLDVYNDILSNFSASSISEILFGHGYMSVSKYVGMLAHNDFLEIIFDFGIIALIVYFIFFLHILIYLGRIYKLRNKLDVNVQVFSSAIVGFLFLGMLNCFITSSVFFSTFTLYFGLAIGNFEREKFKILRAG